MILPLHIQDVVCIGQKSIRICNVEIINCLDVKFIKLQLLFFSETKADSLCGLGIYFHFGNPFKFYLRHLGLEEQEIKLS